VRARTGLTQTQIGIIKDVASSKTRKQIAAERGMIVKGVDYHLLKIYRKLKLDPTRDPRVLLTVWACKRRMVEP
jgi:DNA-binding NarL/FixJ family response regulator